MSTGTINREKHPLSSDGPNAIDLALRHPIATRKSRSAAQRTNAKHTTDEASSIERDPHADVVREQAREEEAVYTSSSSRAGARRHPVQPDTSRSTDELDEEQESRATRRVFPSGSSSTDGHRQGYRFQPTRCQSHTRGYGGRWRGLWELLHWDGVHGLARLVVQALLMGAGGLFLLYGLLFLCLSLCIRVQNQWSYGPTHTAYVHTVLDGQDATIATAALQNTIYVTIYRQQHDGSVQVSTYTAALDTHGGWDGTLSDVVATAQVSQAQGATGATIMVNVTGNVSCLHWFFARPYATLRLLPEQRGGYHLVPS